MARGGRDSIDHPPGGHDDLVNAAAIALVMAIRRATPRPVWPDRHGLRPRLPDEVQRRTDEELEWKRQQGIYRMADILSKQGYHFPGD